MARRPQDRPPAWPRPPLIRRLIWAWHRLRRQQGSPAYRARGLAAGVFTGCLPLFGLQIVLGVALAGIVRGNPLLAAAGTWISNPITNLPLFWMNLQLGILLLGPVESLPLRDLGDGAALLGRADLGWALGGRLLLGSVLVGLVSALLSGALSWRLLRRGRRAGRPQESARPGKTIRSM